MHTVRESALRVDLPGSSYLEPAPSFCLSFYLCQFFQIFLEFFLSGEKPFFSSVPVMLFVDTVSQSGSRARGITTQERSVTVICLFSKQRKALISRTKLACRVASLESSATRM